jgi:2-methylcitrate dehydratase PrpD
VSDVNEQKEPTDLQEKMAEFIADLKFDHLPADIVHDAKYRVLDWIGCALAGTAAQPSRIITELVRETGGIMQATLLRSGVIVPVCQAALANGVAGHLAEFDDGHRMAIAHPGSIAVPTALAVAESFGRTGKDVLTAVVAGYEVIIRLGMAITPSHYEYWHTTSTCGVFGAGAAASLLLRLDKQKTQMALGIAGTMSSGLQETFGTNAKPLNIGHACQSGIQAALLAGKGLTGPTDIIMGKKGFIPATSTEHDITPLTEINDHRFISNTAFYKMYSSCGHTHSPLDAVFKLMSEHDLAVQDIQQIVVETYQTSVALTGQLKNSNEDAAKFSLPYCIAAALVCKAVTLTEFTAEKLQDPVILNLAGKVRVIEDPEASNAFPQRHATVRVELNNKKVFEKKVAGADDAPRYDDIEKKFLSLAQTVIDSESAQKVMNMVLGLDDVADISTLMKYLI